jgi:HK97 family phage major capsid protein
MDSHLAEVKTLIEAQGAAWLEFKEKHIKRLDDLETGFNQFVELSQRPGAQLPVKLGAKPELWIDTKTKRPIPVFAHADSMEAREEKSEVKGTSFGRVLRGLVSGGNAPDAAELAEERKALEIREDPSGGYTVAGRLASQWIDLLRARMVLSRAGARTVPMDTGRLSIARVTADPTTAWHGENAALSASQPTFGLVNLHAKTCTCLVKMSLELSQDSANIESILTSVVTSSMANAIDSAGLNGVSVDAGAAPAGLLNLDGRNTVLAIGTPANWDFALDGIFELMNDNVPLDQIGALVAHPKLWKQQAKLKTGLTSDETSLVQPADVASRQKLYTTACPEAKAVIADWSALLFGVRKSITVKILQEAYLGSNLQIALLAYARVDFAAARPASFTTLEGLTYS